MIDVIMIGLWTTREFGNINVTFFDDDQENVKKLIALSPDDLEDLQFKAAKMFIADRKKFIQSNVHGKQA